MGGEPARQERDLLCGGAGVPRAGALLQFSLVALSSSSCRGALLFEVFFGMSGDGRWRDLLPLPLFRPVPPLNNQSCGVKNFESVSSKRNRIRRDDNVSKVNEVIHAVNEMAGFSAPSAKPAFKAQREAQTVLMKSMASLPRCADRLRMREAIHELLHLSPSSEYMSEEVVRSTVHAFDSGLVSLPD